jgi:uncharacterized protein (DUF433 family)
MKTKLDYGSVLHGLLDLLGEARYARSGCPLREIKGIMAERGVEGQDLEKALGLARDEKWVQPKSQIPVGAKSPWGAETALVLTAKGKAVLQTLRATAQFNVRAPQRLLDELGAVAHQGEKPGAAAIRLLEEGVRMERYPGLAFKWMASGRRPFVLGTGLSVWEIYHIWRDFERNAERVSKAYPYLKPGQVNVAVTYAQAYLHEMPVGAWGEKPAFAQEFKA